MKVDWEWKFGPASVLTVLGALAQAAIMLWVMSSSYTGITKTIEAQGQKIEEIKTGSDKRFETVRDAIKEQRTLASTLSNDMTGIKSVISFMSVQVNRLEDRLNGK